jgi:hypothetical protein
MHENGESAPQGDDFEIVAATYVERLTLGTRLYPLCPPTSKSNCFYLRSHLP